jgi:hypothetical protein
VLYQIDPLATPLSTYAPTDKIRTEYHPGSCRCDETLSVDDYGCAPQSPAHPPHAEPWWPFFNTCEDFLLLEILLEGQLSNELSDRLIKLFNWCLSGKGTLMLTSHSKVLAAWEHTLSKLMPVS